MKKAHRSYSSTKLSDYTESWIFTEQTWSIGEVIRYIRESQGISIHQLSNGVCSVSTLSRIESGKRDPDLMTMEFLFSRLGYQPQQFEMIGTNDEFEQYELRNTIRSCIREHKTSQLQNMLDEYINILTISKKRQISPERDPLHWQFIKEIEGYLSIEQGKLDEGIILFEEAISCTLSLWHEQWYIRYSAGNIELELLHNLSLLYESSGKVSKAYNIRNSIWNYLNKKISLRNQMPQLYTEITCELVPYLLMQKKSVREGINLCNSALKVLSDTNSLYNWHELLILKAKCIEALVDIGEGTKKDIINAYQRAYYVCCLMMNEKKAIEVKQHLEEKYQWESI